MSAPDLAVFWHEAVLGHDTGEGVAEGPPSDLLAVQEPHPENGTRIRNMKAILERGPLAAHVQWHDGRLADRAELETVHPDSYIDHVQSLTRQPTRLDDGTTVVGPGSWEAFLAAAGTSVAATDHVLDEPGRVAYALIRPPGHHAQPAQADGYCFFNNAAIAAERARARGVERVAIVDWDVHHGNGTQACFYDRSDVLTVSLHMRTGLWGPSHPQTGSPQEVGHDEGQGFNVNVELPVGSGDRAYERSFRDIVLPILEQFQPGLIIGGCGQDASTFDPNGRQNVSMDGFHAIGQAIGDAARSLCNGRLVLLQEGGYAVTYAAFCLHATLEGVLGLPARLEDPIGYIPDDFGRAAESVAAVQSALSRSWRFGHVA